METTMAYFENIQNEIIKRVSCAEQSIKIAVAWITDSEIIQILEKKATNGVKVEIVLQDDLINNEKGILQSKYSLKDINIFLNPENENGDLMHNKFCIIDNDIVISGSYNWSYGAMSNDENIIIITGDKKFTRSFKQKFNDLKERISGKKHDEFEIKKVDFTLPEVIPFRKGNYWGFVNSKLNEIYPFVFDKVFAFENSTSTWGYAKNIWHILTRSGLVIKTNFSDVYPFYNNIASVKANGLFGLIDSLGKEILPCKSSAKINYERGLIAAKKNGKWGFVDAQSLKLVVPFIYESVQSFNGNVTNVMFKGKSYLINNVGEHLFCYSEVRNSLEKSLKSKYFRICNFVNGYARVTQGEEGEESNEERFTYLTTINRSKCYSCYYINTNGELIITKEKFRNGYDFNDGFAKVVSENIRFKNCGFINEKGEQKINFIYSSEDVQDFSEGLAWTIWDCAINKDGSNEFEIGRGDVFKKKPFKEQMSEICAIDLGWGFINNQGAILVYPKYEKVEPFKNGLAKCSNNFKDFYIDKKGFEYYEK